MCGGESLERPDHFKLAFDELMECVNEVGKKFYEATELMYMWKITRSPGFVAT